jgi:undecaprenyl diphosphate synthase
MAANLTHVAIIMDGNGRWAKQRGLPRLAGHKAGTENVRQIIKSAVDFNIPYLTLYAFSTENWARPKEEVNGLMRLLSESIDKELDELDREGVQIRHLGDPVQLNANLRKKIQKSVERTKNNQRLVLSIALNYGGRAEIVQAIKRMLEDKVAPEEVNEELVSRYLYTAGLPDPDLIIRTSGEFRTINFLIWQAAYAEWYITPTLWPDFDKEEFSLAIEAFRQRERRFGRVLS